MADPRDISPAKQAEVVTPHATNTIEPTRALYVGTGGDVAVEMANAGGSKTFAGVPDGAILPISVRRVYVSGTTASNILALY